MRFLDIFCNIHGEPVKRTMMEYPYNYDEFCTYKSPDFSDSDKTIFSDRMMSWDVDKFNKCLEEVFHNLGCNFGSREPEDIEKFISLYLGKEIILTGIEQACNWNNGYPYWVFYYK